MDHEEKQTDVNIAVAMMTDAYLDRFDMALLISGDSDLRPPVDRIHELFPTKRVLVASPPGRHSAELARAGKGTFAISSTKVRQSQLPETVIGASGYVLKRPQHWS